ncbi:MAG: carboxypeptidase-like regulatory domain-containing protein [Acidobacteriota bacterium]
MHRKGISRLLFFPVLILFFSFFNVLPSSNEISIKGIVRDSLGNLLSDVNIFVSSDNFNREIINTRTDERGQYTLEKIAPGVYKIAAAKKGYLTNVENVNASSVASLNLTLKPLTAGAAKDAEKIPVTLDWVRRIPKKDLLKKVEAASVLERGSHDDTAEAMARRTIARSYGFSTPDSLPFILELKQVASREMSGNEQEGSGDRKNSVALSFSGNIGSDLKIEFEGQRKKWKEASDTDSLFDSLKRDAKLMGIIGSYDLGKWGTLGFKTFYGTDSLTIKDERFSGLSLFEGSQRGWGYSAGWQRKDDDLAIQVQMSHAGMKFNGDLPYMGLDGSPDDPWSVKNQVINASGNFQASLTAEHEIDIGLRTRFYDNSYPLFRVTSPYDTHSYYGPGEMGKHLFFYGKDHWVIIAPITIGLGVQYYRLYHSGDVQVVIPVFEIEYRAKSGSILKTELSYAMDNILSGGDNSGRASFGAGNPSGHEKDISCKIDLKKEFGSGSISARVSYAPLLLSAEEKASEMPWNDVALYITDGNASRVGAGVFVEKRFKVINGGIGLDYGEVKGTFATVLPDDIPLQMFRQGDMNYLLAILRAYSSESDTELSVRYRKVRDCIYEEGSYESDLPFRYSMISIQVNQRIPIVKVKGVQLRAVVEYDDILAYDDSRSNPLAGLLVPARRVGGGFLFSF